MTGKNQNSIFSLLELSAYYVWGIISKWTWTTRHFTCWFVWVNNANRL